MNLSELVKEIRKFETVEQFCICMECGANYISTGGSHKCLFKRTPGYGSWAKKIPRGGENEPDRG